MPRRAQVAALRRTPELRAVGNVASSPTCRAIPLPSRLAPIAASRCRSLGPCRAWERCRNCWSSSVRAAVTSKRKRRSGRPEREIGRPGHPERRHVGRSGVVGAELAQPLPGTKRNASSTRPVRSDKRPCVCNVAPPTASVPVPTLVPLCSTFVYKRRNQGDTSNSMILVRLWI
jgi:hypothetical protein